MTAPLTPHDQPPPPPPYSGAELPGDASKDARAAFLTELRQGALVAVAVAVTGVLLGLLWLWLAPRIPLVSDGKAIYLKDSEGEEAIGADGTFVLLGLAMGVLTAAAVFWRYRRGGIGVVLGLAVGGLLGSVIAWRLGAWLGPTGDLIAHAKAVGPKVVFGGPLRLRAKGALVAWPAAAMLAHLCLTSALGPRDPQSWDNPYPAPHPAPVPAPPPEDARPFRNPEHPSGQGS
ncbi:ABC transporter permease [Streptomyces sp. H10-C2]|uniref:ABC transporter permease n=1 Tax=unclassified Streptomyces TaxID=2593676 RepID=UPI0024B91603|nr:MULTISPECIES: ABC transporter permease [unclassified Streptomyces]MDJ0344536.1 ABC transporter permease [Streptomyces sp. PH10-H1]MDJ0369590.1 ABC transporter permease [Streptomyces sp. H10-C2]